MLNFINNGLFYFVLGFLTVNELLVELEEEEIVENISNLPTPVKE